MQHNAKVQETIEGIVSNRLYWPSFPYNKEEREKRLKEAFILHSKPEWAFIYKECVKRKERFYGDLRELGYDDDYWYKMCYQIDEIKQGCYPYIPFSPTKFYKKIKNLAVNYKIKSFLDVGAGYGDKVLIAKEIIEKADGIEYVKEYVKVAKSFGIDLIHADAFEFQNYKDYDLLYMFHPIHSEELYAKLVTHLLEEMKAGGYLLEVYDPHREFIDIVKRNKDKFNLRIISSSYNNGTLIKKKIKGI